MKRVRLFFGTLGCLAIIISIIISTVIITSGSTGKNDSKMQVSVIGTAQDDETMMQGDCIIVSVGNIQILIDSGKTSGASFNKIKSMMQEALADDDEKVWEYIIFTHPDDDHIGNYESIFNLFYKSDDWKLKYLIDYDLDEINVSAYSSGISSDYRKDRNDLIAKHSDITYFSAASLNPTDLVKTFQLSDNSTLNILYNEYDSLSKLSTNGSVKVLSSNQKNNMSVCTLLTFGSQKVLFTGDITEAAESSLVENHTDLLKNVTLYKAAHHGSAISETPSNTQKLIDVIKPAYVTITSNKRADISDESINQFLKYTDYVFPSFVAVEKDNSDGQQGTDNTTEVKYDYYLMYGDETFILYGDNKVDVVTKRNYSNKKVNTLLEALIEVKGNEVNWFFDCVNSSKRDLKDLISVYTFDEGLPTYSNCTLIKYGHLDILIDCGSLDVNSSVFVDKLKNYVVDGTIDYVIVTHNHSANMNQLFSLSSDVRNNKGEVTTNIVKTGVFDSFEIGKVIYNSFTNFNDNNTSSGGHYQSFLSAINKMENNSRNSTYCMKKTNEKYELCSYASLKGYVWGSNYDSSPDEENDYSLSVLLSFHNEKFLFVGDLVSYDVFMENHKKEISNLNYFRISNSQVDINKMEGFKEFAKWIKPKVAVIGTPVFYNLGGKTLFDYPDQRRLLDYLNFDDNCKIYYSSMIDDPAYTNGDLRYCVSVKNNIVQESYDAPDIYAKSNLSNSFDKKPITLNDYYEAYLRLLQRLSNR